MNAIVIEHVKVEELPADWRARLAAASDVQGSTRVTVRIEAETGSGDEAVALPTGEDDPLFGMWQDREDMADVAGYVRTVRAPRFADEDATPGR